METRIPERDARHHGAVPHKVAANVQFILVQAKPLDGLLRVEEKSKRIARKHAERRQEEVGKVFRTRDGAPMEERDGADANGADAHPNKQLVAAAAKGCAR